MTTTIDVDALEAERQRIMERKKALEALLGQIKHRMLGCGRIPHGEFTSLSSQRAQAVAQMAKHDMALATIGKRLRDCRVEHAQIRNAMHRQENDGRAQHVLRGLLRLRDGYRAEAQDRMRTEAFRFMATTFADQLDNLFGTIPKKAP